jgi:magnesium chelatase subunit H
MTTTKKIVSILCMEQYNGSFWNDVKTRLSDHADLTTWTDVDLANQNPTLAAAMLDADCIFASMVVFKDQAEWFQAQVAASRAKTVFVYESMPEANLATRVGNFVMKGGAGGGMPAGMKSIAKLLVKGRDEDALYGYIKLLKVMQKILPLLPKKARDFKNWMQVYTYWTQPTLENVVSMFRYILHEYFDESISTAPAVDVPSMGLYHPDAPAFFKDVSSFNKWNKKRLSKSRTNPTQMPRLGLLMMRKHLLQENGYIQNVIRSFEAKGFYVYPAFVMGVEGHVVVRDWLAKEQLDLIVNMIGFRLIGGPAGSTMPTEGRNPTDEILKKLDVPYIVAQPLLMQDFESWKAIGANAMQTTLTYALPEMDGAIAPVVLGAIKDGHIETLPDRLERLSTLAFKWAALRHKKNRDKKLAVIVYDYPPGLGKKATAALMDVPKTLFAVLKRLEAEGYDTGKLPETPQELFDQLDASTDYAKEQSNKNCYVVTAADYKEIVSQRERDRIEERWQKFPGDIVPMGMDKVFLGGLRFGNIYIGIQPRLGVSGDPMRLLFDKANTPHHQYISFYRWISRRFAADAMIHVGMHGSVEWLPGLQLGLTADCWSDALLGEVPHLYLYPVNNPSESTLAKRRGYAVMISHAIPPLSHAGLYKELPALKDLLNDYRERLLQGQDDPDAEEVIIKKVELLNLHDDCPRHEKELFRDYMSRLYAYLAELENRLITEALHTFGDTAAAETQRTTVAEVLKAASKEPSLPTLLMRSQKPDFDNYGQLAAAARSGNDAAIALREKIDADCKAFVDASIFDGESVVKTFQRLTAAPLNNETLEILKGIWHDGQTLVKALSDNSQELNAVVHVLAGGYLSSGAGGDLLRDGIHVLPTGRNIHAIDPWRIPSALAFKRGARIADAVLQKHLEENGTYPETIAEVLWGLDTIKTKGEAVAMIVRFIGAEPAYDGQGKISHYSLTPIEKLGRPRVDVLMQLSPIFRDTFGILMDSLDRLVVAAAKADEPHEKNFIRKHVDEALAKGIAFESATARLFTQAQGMYGTYVDDMVEDSAWDSDDDLDSQFIRRNSFVYGGKRHGQKESEVLNRLLGTVDRVVHQVDSVEYGISDIDHYFSTSGSLQLGANKRKANGAAGVKLNYIEAFTADTKIEDVDKALRMEYRAKLLNPKWYEGMLKHNHSGAAEISNRFTYMLGWDAVTKSVDDWVYQKAAETYALDDAMRKRLQDLNPEAIKNITSRLLEANGRGLWKADEETLEKLRDIYEDLEDRLEMQHKG